MSGHTPGKWFTTQQGHSTIYVEARLVGGMLQEVAACGPTEAWRQQEANARLIAAAPELLDALQASMMDLEYAVALAGSHNVMRANAISIRLCTVRAVIAAATGEQA